jgi:hypothetical protein
MPGGTTTITNRAGEAMKQSQWVLAAGVLAVMVFGLTFAVNYLGSNDPAGGAATSGENKSLLELTFPVGKAVPAEAGLGARLEHEEGTPGQQDFWFENRNTEPVTMGLVKTNCRCTSVEAFVLPVERADAARKLIAHEGGGTWFDSSAVFFQPALALFQEGLTGSELKQQVASIDVPAGAIGWVRLKWSGEKTGNKSSLEANLWMGDANKGKLATLSVALIFHDALRYKLDPDEAMDFQDEALAKGMATRTIYCWSSTRPKFRLEVTPGGNPSGPFEIGAVQPLDADARENLAKANWANASTRDVYGGSVLCGYKVTIKLKSTSADGKVPFPLGSYYLGVLLSSPDIEGHSKQVVLVGKVTGWVEVVNNDRYVIDFDTFKRSVGKHLTIRLDSDHKDLDLKFVRERTPGFLAATVTLERKGSEDEPKRWRLEARVLPGKASGPFPRREDPAYADSAVYLRAEKGSKGGKKETKIIRIVVKGVASES